MLSDATRLLANDHTSVDRLLARLHVALANSDAGETYATLDLFWARLAVHIRAEHLHLFPAILTRANNMQKLVALKEVEATIRTLRDDHDFFMHELGGAITTLRDLIATRNQSRMRAGLEVISGIIISVEERLRQHNETEEETIYRWVSYFLSTEEQLELAGQIENELTKRPLRFATDSWM